MEAKELNQNYDRELRISILDESSVSVAREAARKLTAHSGFELIDRENVALIVSELAHNQLAHAQKGEITIRIISGNDAFGIEIIAIDQGPGILNPTSALAGGYSTKQSLGYGLSSIYQHADEVDFDIRLGEGTCISARKFLWNKNDLPYELAIFGRPYPGETISGDQAIFTRSNDGFIAAVVDGVGHGQLARDASNLTIEIIQSLKDLPSSTILEKCDNQLIGSRGSVIALSRYLKSQGIVECTGGGDITSQTYSKNGPRYFSFSPHLFGRRSPRPFKFRSENESVTAGSVLISFTDGLKSSTTLSDKLDILRQPAIAIAQYLIENYSRLNDDSLVFVAKFGGGNRL